MQWEYRVMLLVDLVSAPSYWQFPTAKAQECATMIEDALNRMASEGWEFVGNLHDQWTPAMHLVFRRAKRADSGTAFQEGRS